MSSPSIVVYAASAGTLGTVFAQQPLFAAAYALILYAPFYVWAHVRGVPSTTQVAHATLLVETVALPVAALLVGTVLGVVFVWALRSPLLVDTPLVYMVPRITKYPGDEWHTLFYPWHQCWYVSLAVLVAAVCIGVAHCADIEPPDIEGLTSNDATRFGIVLGVLGALGALVAGTVACTQQTPNGRNGGLALGYSVLLAALVATPVIYDVARTSLSYYAVFVVAATLVVVYGALGVAHAKLVWRAVDTWRRIEFWFALAIVHIALVSVALVAVEFYNDARPVTVVLVVEATLIIVVLAVYGRCTQSTR